jgi:hypothetical protein
MDGWIIAVSTAQGEGVGQARGRAAGDLRLLLWPSTREDCGANVDGTNELASCEDEYRTRCVNPEEDRFIVDELFTDTTSLWLAKKGSNEPQLLHTMSADWFAPQNGVLQPTPFHPHARFLPSGTAVVFNSGGEIYMLDM